jgi:alkanesulfonate monooxygenase SsuD/methylene tetrahydromethanopterin reductase-like flavin-dependent oxidoreductase (luciferase family)
MQFGTFHLIGSPDMKSGQQRFDETLEQIALADKLGFDSVWVAEHHFSNYGYSVNPLLLIAKASALAPRVRFGQAIIVTPFWHPIRLAEDIALTDILTGGRLELGLGRGYQPYEFQGLGASIEQSREVFLEQLDLMEEAWTEDDFTYDGRFYKIPKPITVLPRPVQQPFPPIWVATQSLETLDWTAASGYNLLMTGGSSTSLDQIGEWIRHYHERRAACGHDPDEGRVAVLRFVYVTDTDDQAREAIGQTRWQRRCAWHLREGDERITAGQNENFPFPDEPSDEAWWDTLVYGSPERCIAQLRRDAELGITDALGWFDVGDLPNDAVLHSMDRFAREVMPALGGVRVG